jgi:glycerol-3-phosphate dehydrogenase (NAD(P)+)
MASIVIMGSGIMGSALAVPLCDNGHDVRLVGTHLDRDIIDSVKASGEHPGLKLQLPESVHPYQLEDAEEAFDGAEVVLSGVNSFGVGWAGEQLARLLRPDTVVIAIAKGLDADDEGNLRILPEVLAEPVPTDVRSRVGWAAITGPSIAGEVAVHRDTCVVFAGPDEEVVERLADLFRTSAYHVWTSTDLVGAEVCAAMKNCYALAIGLADGVLEQMGEADAPYGLLNYEAALFAQGNVEMRRMVELLGGDTATADGLPATGDCYVTSRGGRNVKVGRLMGRGMGFAEASASLGNPTLEGAFAIQVVGRALPKLTERGIIEPEEFPLLRHLYEVVGEEKPLNMPWSRFFGGERQTTTSSSSSS